MGDATEISHETNWEQFKTCKPVEYSQVQTLYAIKKVIGASTEWASKQNPIESLFASKVKMLRVLIEKKWNAAKALELVNDIERLLTDTAASPLAFLIELGSAELRKRLMPTQDSGKTLLKILANASEDSGKTQQMLQDTVVEEVDGQAT